MDGQKNNLYIPGAILIVGLLIAGAIYSSNKGSNNAKNTETIKESGLSFKPLSKEDHILGNPEAPITILEYSDTECPFCKDFNDYLKVIVSEYGKTGKVALAYRNFPLNIHPKSQKEAEALECASDIGGGAKFWEYYELIMSKKIGYKALASGTPSNGGIDPKDLSSLASQIGIDKTKFEDCLSNGKFTQTVNDDIQDGVKAGVQGTPYSIMILREPLNTTAENTINDFIIKNGLTNNISIIKNKKEIVLNGALPVELIRPIIEAIIK